MVSNSPNAFIQVNLPKKKGSEQFYMEIVSGLVDCLVEIVPETYLKYVVR